MDDNFGLKPKAVIRRIELGEIVKRVLKSERGSQEAPPGLNN